MFCLPLFLILSKGTSQFLVQFVHIIGFLKIHFFCHSSQKHDSQYQLPAFQSATVSLFSNTVHSIQKWLMHKASIFCAFKAIRTRVFRSSCHFVPKDNNKLFISTHSVKQDGRVNPATKQSILIDLSANFTCVGLDNQVWDM